MKKNLLVSITLGATLLGLSLSANAGFSGPFDWWDSNDGYNRYGYGPGYRGDRWRRYDKWEPNYWRYRYFDEDSRDYLPDQFDRRDRYRSGRRYRDAYRRPAPRSYNRSRRDRSRYYGDKPDQMSETPQAKRHREELKARQPGECR